MDEEPPAAPPNRTAQRTPRTRKSGPGDIVCERCGRVLLRADAPGVELGPLTIQCQCGAVQRVAPPS